MRRLRTGDQLRTHRHRRDACVITHRIPLDDAPAAYKTFRDKEDGCIKVVLKP